MGKCTMSESPFHDTHYGLFHVALPRVLRDGSLDEFLDASQAGDGGEMLAEFWRVIARQVVGTAPGGRLPADLEVDSDDFSLGVSRPASGLTLLVMTGPQVRGPLEAACVVAGFRDGSPSDSLRYFTCEAPVSVDQPWMVGEWLGDGSRRNLGPIENPSVDVMRGFVTRQMGAGQERRGSEFPNRAGVREIPNVEALLGGAGGTRPPAPAASTVGGIPFRGAGDFPRAGDPSVMGAALDGPGAGVTPSIPSVSGPVSFSVSWSSGAGELASAALTNLYRIRTGGGRALVMSAKKTKGLAKKTSSYVQFMWNDDSSLIVEIQGDYSYWGLSVPSESWPYLESRGLTVPTGGVGNFGLVVPANSSHENRLSVLKGAFEAFQVVLQPQGRVAESHF